MTFTNGMVTQVTKGETNKVLIVYDEGIVEYVLSANDLAWWQQRRNQDPSEDSIRNLKSLAIESKVVVVK